ncbi:hypothetical protein TRIUR3_31497 [Triticum urartu]|uniref:Uncharacterized protein n=1 Tax=Triticum urartu TaxID=4572 RepID=M7ZEY5_TRIUA|nr:hypothetical protein TRIUR3_31497 [Triticum urartu]
MPVVGGEKLVHQQQLDSARGEDAADSSSLFERKDDLLLVLVMDLQLGVVYVLYGEVKPSSSYRWMAGRHSGRRVVAASAWCRWGGEWWPSVCRIEGEAGGAGRCSGGDRLSLRWAAVARPRQHYRMASREETGDDARSRVGGGSGIRWTQHGVGAGRRTDPGTGRGTGRTRERGRSEGGAACGRSRAGGSVRDPGRGRGRWIERNRGKWWIARSGLVDLGNEALPHVNDPPVHLIACVHALGCEPKVLAAQAHNTECVYIVSGFHRGELVVGAVDKPVETVARLCGHAVVVDEDMMAHAQLGDGNLLIYAETTGGVLEVDADRLVLVSSKQLLNVVDVVVHHVRVDGVHH